MGKDMQRALLWAILFTSCFLLWDNYQVYKGEKSFFHTEAVEQQAVARHFVVVPVDAVKIAVEQQRQILCAGLPEFDPVQRSERNDLAGGELRFHMVDHES